jgi:hypothetical protein
MVEEVNQRKDAGAALPEGTRVQMEGYFGADLSDVRVHTDGEAAALSRELNANAFTVGRDIFFAADRFNPGTADGQATLAHELTHVGQQTGFAAPAAAPAAQREGPEEDELQMEALQRQPAQEEEEEELQMEAVQRQEVPEEDELAT